MYRAGARQPDSFDEPGSELYKRVITTASVSVAATVDTESPTVPSPGGRRGWRGSRTIGGLVIYEQVKVQSHLLWNWYRHKIFTVMYLLGLQLVPIHTARHYSNIYRISIQINSVIWYNVRERPSSYMAFRKRDTYIVSGCLSQINRTRTSCLFIKYPMCWTTTNWYAKVSDIFDIMKLKQET